MNSIYRPWGPLWWLLDHCPERVWSFYGAINTEDRCIESWKLFFSRKLLGAVKLIEIANPPSRLQADADLMLAERRDIYIGSGGSEADIESHQLNEPYGKIIESAERFVRSAVKSVVLDVSSMPKRFFFPVLRVLMKSDNVSDLIVTYTVPNAYTGEKLALNCDDWDHLPTFSGDYTHTPTAMLIVNVGFEPMGLPDVLGEDNARPIKLLFPFPAPPESVNRAWGFVQTLQRGRSSKSFAIHHTDVKEISDAYDRLCKLTENGQRRAVLAPFGPKTISVAMCLFAIDSGAEVYYTQPSAYHPAYSTGIARVDGEPLIYGYWIKMGGTSLYKLS